MRQTLKRWHKILVLLLCGVGVAEAQVSRAPTGITAAAPVLSWAAPSALEGGAAITEPLTFTLYRGTATARAALTTTDATTYTETTTGDWCYHVTAKTPTRNESQPSAVACMTVAGAPPPPPVPPVAFNPGPAPACKPAQVWSETTTDGRVVTFGYCEDAAGLKAHWVARDPRDFAGAAACLAGLPPFIWTDVMAAPLDWLQAAWRACATRPLTDTERATGNELARKWSPRFVVSGTTNQIVYTKLADGTRGPAYAVAGVTQRVASSLPCYAGERLLGTTTRYMSVWGQKSTTGVDIPEGSYAQCTRNAPPAAGWAN